jgi:hypothetical protein
MKPISSMHRRHYVPDLKVNHGPQSSQRFYWLGAESTAWSIEARPLPHHVEFVTHVAVVFPFGQA